VVDTTFNTYTAEKQAVILSDFMGLFRGNERGFGVGEFVGARQRESDGKWTPHHVRWQWGIPGIEEYRLHLTGVRLMGIGVLRDDSKVMFACLDLDEYEIDYSEIMASCKRLNLPLVVFRTKSGGLRIVIFFSEPVEAELAQGRMRRLRANLGFNAKKCEVFPKQVALIVEKDDCPSWIFLPYGGTGGVFPEQGCMNDAGNLMEIDEAVEYCKERRITRDQFVNLFAAEKAADDNGKKHSKRHPERVFAGEGDKGSIVDEIFHDGPVCLRVLARNGVGQGHQNYFLAHCATFLMRKYENWEMALNWVNYNVLNPPGDHEKLNDMIKRWGKHKYDYQCKNEPMVGFCDAEACRHKRFGVGPNGPAGFGYPEFGLTIVRDSKMMFCNIGSKRAQVTEHELASSKNVQIKYLELREAIPPLMKHVDHIAFVNRAMENATVVDSMKIQRVDASELELLTGWFGRKVPPWIKRGTSNDKTDEVRVKVEERRIYFKWVPLAEFLRQRYSHRDVMAVRTYIGKVGEEHREGRGHWWRYTYSVNFELFDEEEVEKWLNPE
jgi:hypothetical protein